MEADFSQELYETSIIRDNVSFFRAMLLRVFSKSISHSNSKILLRFLRAVKSFNFNAFSTIVLLLSAKYIRIYSFYSIEHDFRDIDPHEFTS